MLLLFALIKPFFKENVLQFQIFAHCKPIQKLLTTIYTQFFATIKSPIKFKISNLSSLGSTGMSPKE